MDTLPTGFFTELLKLGVAGAFIIYLIWTNWRKDQDLKDLGQRIDALQDKRVAEAIETVRTLGESANANEKMAHALETMASAMGSSQDRRPRR